MLNINISTTAFDFRQLPTEDIELITEFLHDNRAIQTPNGSYVMSSLDVAAMIHSLNISTDSIRYLIELFVEESSDLGFSRGVDQAQGNY
jgi:hypothetical protein